MANPSKYLHLIPFLLLFMAQISHARLITGQRIKTKVYLSPKIELEPGQVSNKVYSDLEFPKGHIAIKAFDAELVDERGYSVPLHEAYLHHWLVVRYHREINNESNVVAVQNSGVCNPEIGLSHYFGLGSETRRTPTDIPDPYGIVVGNPAEVPNGFREGWMLNVHTIDTRNAEDKRGCLECACNLYSNITMPEPLPQNYSGGVRCCTDGARCRVKEGSGAGRRSIYLKYVVKYVDWDASVIPLRVYIIDATDLWTKTNESAGVKITHNCQVEHDVEACTDHASGCIDTKTLKLDFEEGGDVIYGVGHQHVGASNIALYGEGGREICISHAKYGTGKEAGNEAGYVVGMSTCYPRPGSVKISAGETLTLVSNYSSAQKHTGVMSLFYLLVA